LHRSCRKEDRQLIQRFASVLILPQYRALAKHNIFGIAALASTDSMSSIKVFDFPTEEEYLDWVFGWFPTKMKEVTNSEDLESVDARHIEWKRVSKGEKVTSEILGLKKKLNGAWYVPSKVPDAKKYDGLRSDDVCATIVRDASDTNYLRLKDRAKKIGVTIYEFKNFPDRIPGDYPDLTGNKKEIDIKLLWICCVQMYRYGGRGFDEGPPDGNRSSRS